MNKWQNPWGMSREQLLSKWGHVLEWTDEIFTWTSPEELCFLAEMASRSSKLLEIGSYHGKSALVMALANPNAKLICIDACMDVGAEEAFTKNLSIQMAEKKLFFVKGTSEWLRDSPLIHEFDGSFIDAGHLEPDVNSDIANSLPHMAPGALLCGHDWRPDMNDGVNRGVLSHFDQSLITVWQSIWWVRLP